MKASSPDYPRLTFRELEYRPSDLAVLERFYWDVYVPEFPDRDERESLQNMETYLRLKANGWYGHNNYHIVLGFQGDTAAAGSFADYLEEPNSGVIEFLVVAPPLRKKGVGRKLLEETERHLANDAVRLMQSGLDVIVAEMNDPFKAGKDSLDAFVRASIWDRWGFGLLDFPYVQPALSAHQARVDGLLLIAKPCCDNFQNALPAAKVRAVLRAYMRWAMRIEAPDEAVEYQSMSRYLAAENVPILGLAAYAGHDEARPFVVHDIDAPSDPDFTGALSVYARAFPGGRTDLHPDQFRSALMAGQKEGLESRYHLWAIRSRHDAPVEGMASFFAFPRAGFGGYIALQGSLVHTRRFPLLLARIEERMIRDELAADGWYIECDQKQEALFARNGFYTLDLVYAQPPLPAGPLYQPHEAPPLCLMYKTFGRTFCPPSLPVPSFLDTMGRVFGTVYGVDNVLQSPFYARLAERAASWPEAKVRFRSAPA